MARKHKPVATQLAEGDKSKLGKHKLEAKLARTPPTVPGLPDAPNHLGKLARETWDFWRLELIGMQLDSRCDAQMLEGACLAYARAVEADIQVAREGITIREPVYFQGKRQTGLFRVKKHPAVTISNANWSQVRSFCSEFGLSPAARARLSIAPAGESGEDVDKVLSGPTLTADEKKKIMQ